MHPMAISDLGISGTIIIIIVIEEIIMRTDNVVRTLEGLTGEMTMALKATRHTRRTDRRRNGLKDRGKAMDKTNEIIRLCQIMSEVT